MKWKFFCVAVVNLVVIGTIACGWPYPPHPPIPLELWEDHYMRVNHVPYAHSVPHLSHEALSEPESIHPNILYPMNHMQHMISAEPDLESSQMNLGNDMRELVEYSQRDPMVRLHHGNYRYRKRIKVPLTFNQKGFHHKKEVKYQMGFGHKPRRYNNPQIHNWVPKLNYPNSVNDKLSEPKKSVVLEEESHQQNKNSNIASNNNKNDDKNDDKKSLKDEQEVGSQTKSKNNGIQSTSITQNTQIPIEITSYAMQTPDGAVTQVTEMLYDIANNPFKVSTSTPVISPFLPPSTASVITSTDDPKATQTPYLNSGYSESEAGSFPLPPINSAVSAKFDGITMSPVISWTSQRSTINPVTTWTSQRSLPTPPARQTVPTTPSESANRRHRKKVSTYRPSSTTNRNSARESEPGLSGAAIAGIVIGSMVSVMLLAGTSLFVMYRNPFKRTGISQTNSNAFVENSLPNVIQTNDSNTIPRVHRWPPRRQRHSNR